jgi:hypothetical protein
VGINGAAGTNRFAIPAIDVIIGNRMSHGRQPLDQKIKDIVLVSWDRTLREVLCPDQTSIQNQHKFLAIHPFFLYPSKTFSRHFRTFFVRVTVLYVSHIGKVCERVKTLFEKNGDHFIKKNCVEEVF